MLQRMLALLWPPLFARVLPLARLQSFVNNEQSRIMLEVDIVLSRCDVAFG